MGHIEMLSVTLRRIEHAVAVHDYGGVSAAARALNVSQPSLSVSVAQLEADLGRRLFVRRKGQGIKPTTFGSTFIQNARLVLGQARALMDVPTAGSDATGRCAVGCFEDLAPFHLAGIVRTLAQECPNIQVTYEVSGFNGLARDLRQGAVDIALTYDLGLDDTIDRHALAQVRPHALVAATHPCADQGAVALRDVANDPLILTKQDLSWQHILDLFRMNNIEPRIGTQAGSFELQRSFVANGLGIAICYARPRALTSYDGKTLCALEISDHLPVQQILMAHSNSNPPTAATRRVMQLIAKSFAPIGVAG